MPKHPRVSTMRCCRGNGAKSSGANRQASLENSFASRRLGWEATAVSYTIIPIRFDRAERTSNVTEKLDTLHKVIFGVLPLPLLFGALFTCRFSQQPCHNCPAQSFGLNVNTFDRTLPFKELRIKFRTGNASKTASQISQFPPVTRHCTYFKQKR